MINVFDIGEFVSLNRKKNGKIVLAISLIIVLFVVLGVVAYRMYANYVAESEGYPRKNGVYIAIDAGHGGVEVGAVSSYNGQEMCEKDINLAVANRLKTALEEKGYKVMMTREDDSDVSISKRIDMIDKYNPHFTISIHCDSIGGEASATANGFSVLYEEESSLEDNMISNEKYANIVEKAYANSSGLRRRGVISRSDLGLLKTENPSVLLEMGFISNPVEIEKLLSEDFQNSVVNALSKSFDKVIEEIENLQNIEERSENNVQQ